MGGRWRVAATRAVHTFYIGKLLLRCELFVFFFCSFSVCVSRLLLAPCPLPLPPTPCSFLPFVLWFSAQPEISLEPTRRPPVMAAIDYRRARFEIITVHHLHQMHLQMQMQLQMQFQFTQQTTISTAAVGHVLCK